MSTSFPTSLTNLSNNLQSFHIHKSHEAIILSYNFTTTPSLSTSSVPHAPTFQITLLLTSDLQPFLSPKNPLALAYSRTASAGPLTKHSFKCKSHISQVSFPYLPARHKHIKVFAAYGYASLITSSIASPPSPCSLKKSYIYPSAQHIRNSSRLEPSLLIVSKKEHKIMSVIKRRETKLSIGTFSISRAVKQNIYCFNKNNHQQNHICKMLRQNTSTISLRVRVVTEWDCCFRYLYTC